MDVTREDVLRCADESLLLKEGNDLLPPFLDGESDGGARVIVHPPVHTDGIDWSEVHLTEEPDVAEVTE